MSRASTDKHLLRTVEKNQKKNNQLSRVVEWYKAGILSQQPRV